MYDGHDGLLLREGRSTHTRETRAEMRGGGVQRFPPRTRCTGWVTRRTSLIGRSSTSASDGGQSSAARQFPPTRILHRAPPRRKEHRERYA